MRYEIQPDTDHATEFHGDRPIGSSEIL